MVLVAELIALLLTLNASFLPLFSWDSLALYSFQIQWISLISALIICRMRPWLRSWTPVQAGLASYGVVLVTTIVMSILGQYLLQGFATGMFMRGQTFQLNGWQLFNNLLTSAILSGITLRYLYLQQQLRNQQQAELHARIQALQSRIRPHFLFNSMNSIASLIGSDPELAERVIEDLAELFRASLAEPTLIPLEREITLCRRYLEIEQLRLGSRLTVDWQIHTHNEEIKIPSLMLQPLVENAIFHGVEPMPKGGAVTIKISQAKNQLMIAITNPYPLIKKVPPQTQTPSQDRHNHMALDNIRHRLQVHYGNAARLSSSEEQGVFTTYIFCPLSK
ncbi:MAG: transcriptional regulator [Moraxellaceae bacterium]|nr:MAG: transcriptional regulator [Moraxellaceae bacterium]